MFHSSTQNRLLLSTIPNPAKRDALAHLLWLDLDDRINKRAALAASLASNQENGMVALFEGGRDCDGVRYHGRSCGLIPATVQAYWQEHSRIAEWADGPFYLQIVKPSEAELVVYTSRDLVLEAYEDGHPHRIVTDF